MNKNSGLHIFKEMDDSPSALFWSVVFEEKHITIKPIIKKISLNANSTYLKLDVTPDHKTERITTHFISDTEEKKISKHYVDLSRIKFHTKPSTILMIGDKKDINYFIEFLYRYNYISLNTFNAIKNSFLKRELTRECLIL